MIQGAMQKSGPLMTVDTIVEGAMMLIDNSAEMAGKVMSVCRELGFALHSTPFLMPANATGNAADHKAKALPHKQIKPLQSKL
jgi:hypothetical protein